MISGTVIVFAVVNMAFFYSQYYLVTKFCRTEDEEWERYRRMKDLEIKLLNNKIEEMYARNHGL